MARRKRGRDVHGIIVVNKPIGLSSNQVLQKVKRIFNANKAGHTGALDPLATGVLPICLGEATKFSQVLLDADKGYRTTARLGEIRTTGDAEGDVIQTKAVPCFSDQDVVQTLGQYLGPIEQVPPLFSALKLNGQPLYKLARQGLSATEMAEIADKKRRTVTIHQLDLLRRDVISLDLNVRCSKGTYIRSLVEDIGNTLGCGAYVSFLHRTLSAPYDESHMYSLEELQDLGDKQNLGDKQDWSRLDSLLLPLETAIPDTWPCYSVSESDVAKLKQGQKIRIDPDFATGLSDIPPVQLRASERDGSPCIAIGRLEGEFIYPSKVLNR